MIQRKGQCYLSAVWSVQPVSLCLAIYRISLKVQLRAMTLLIALQSKTAYKKAVDYTKNINLSK